MGSAERVANKNIQKTPQQQQKNPFNNFKKPQGCDGNCGACPMMRKMLQNILSLPEAEQQEKLNEIKNMNVDAHKIILSKLSEEKANALVEQGPAKLNEELISGKDSFLEFTESPKKENPKDNVKSAEPVTAEESRTVSYSRTESTTPEIAEFRIMQNIRKQNYKDNSYKIGGERQHEYDETKGADISSGKVGGTGYTSEQIRTDPHLRRLYGYLLGLFDSEEKPIQKERDFKPLEARSNKEDNPAKNEQQDSEKKDFVFVDNKKEKPKDNVENKNEAGIQIDKGDIEDAGQSESSSSFKEESFLGQKTKEKLFKNLSKIKKKIENFLDKKKEQKQEKTEKKEHEEKAKEEEKKKNEQKSNSKKPDEKENKVGENNKEQKKKIKEEKKQEKEEKQEKKKEQEKKQEKEEKQEKKKEQEEKQEKQKEETKKKTKEEKGNSKKIEEKKQEFEFQKKIKVFFKKEGLSEEAITELLIILFDKNKEKRSRALEKLSEKEKKILIKLFKCKNWEELKSLLLNNEQNKLKWYMVRLK